MRVYVPLLRSAQWVEAATEQVDCEALDIGCWIKGRDHFDPALPCPKPQIRVARLRVLPSRFLGVI